MASYYPPFSNEHPDEAAQRLAARCILWRALTADLLRVVGRHQARYSLDFVVGIIRQAMGRCLKPSQELNDDLGRLAKYVVGMDWHMHCSEKRWEFHFADPATGKPHGFPYKASKDVVTHRYNTDGDEEEGRPVDVISAPLVLSMGDYLRPVGDWTSALCCKARMEVAVDMFPDEDGSDVDEEDQRVEAKEEQEEDKGRRDAVAE